jgi:Flp pilus assembly protein TadD
MTEVGGVDTFREAREHHRAGRYDEAIGRYREVLSRQPDHAEAMHLLGLATLHAGKTDEAIEIMQRAMELDSSRAEYHYNLASALAAASRRTDAATEFGEAMRINPRSAEAAFNLGRQLRLAGYLEDAADALRLAIFLHPDAPIVHSELGLTLMQSGELLEGWREYQWRWKELKPIFPQPAFSQTFWDGSDPAGKRILIYGEGGYGDALHFVRYGPLLAQRGATVFLLCHPEMYRLFLTVKDVAQVIPVNQPWPKFDLHCPLLSLPHFFGTTLETIPASVPYLSADPQLSLRWRRRLLAAEAGKKKFNVGLVWSGDPTHGNNLWRSVKLEQLAPLAAVKTVRFYSLQKGSPGAEARRPPGGMEMIDWTGEFVDWADTAAFVDHLDLVISVCTSTCHLAGALGKRVWLLSHYPGDWRWMMDREDSPWYPSMRIFRCSAENDWNEPIGKMAAALLELAGA